MRPYIYIYILELCSHGIEPYIKGLNLKKRIKWVQKKILLYLVLSYSNYHYTDEVMTDYSCSRKLVKGGAFFKFCVSGVPGNNCPVTKSSQEPIYIPEKLALDSTLCLICSESLVLLFAVWVEECCIIILHVCL